MDFGECPFLHPSWVFRDLGVDTHEMRASIVECVFDRLVYITWLREIFQ